MICWNCRVVDEDVIDVLRDGGVEAWAASTARDYCDVFGWHFGDYENDEKDGLE